MQVPKAAWRLAGRRGICIHCHANYQGCHANTQGCHARSPGLSCTSKLCNASYKVCHASSRPCHASAQGCQTKSQQPSLLRVPKTTCFSRNRCWSESPAWPTACLRHSSLGFNIRKSLGCVVAYDLHMCVLMQAQALLPACVHCKAEPLPLAASRHGYCFRYESPTRYRRVV